MYCLRQRPRAAAGTQAICTEPQAYNSSTTTQEHGGGPPITACTTDGQNGCACVIASGITLTLRRHAGCDGYMARIISDGSAFVLSASLQAEACKLDFPAPPASADPAAAPGAGSHIAAATRAACEPEAPVCARRTALQVTTADGAWVQADTSGAVTMVGPPLPGLHPEALDATLSPGASRAWRGVLPGGATAQGWADGRVRVLHPDGCASLRLPRGWGLEQGSGHKKGFGQAASAAAAADQVSAQDLAAICAWAAALLSGSTWPRHADSQGSASPEPDSSHMPSKLCPLPAVVWVRTNSAGQRWAELDPLEALALDSSTPSPPPPAETPPQLAVPAPAPPVKPPSAKTGAAQSVRAALSPIAGEAPGETAKPAGEDRAANGKPQAAQAAGAAAPRRSMEPRRPALQAAAAPEAPVDTEQPRPPPLPLRLLLLPPVPTESALDADTGCLIRARVDGVLALAYPNGDRLVQDADGARVKFMPEREAMDPSRSPAGVPAALPESWVAEAARCPAVSGSAAVMQVRTRALLTLYKQACGSCIRRSVSALLWCCAASRRAACAV